MINKLINMTIIFGIATLVNSSDFGVFTSKNIWDNDYDITYLPTKFSNNLAFELNCVGENNLYSAIMLGNRSPKNKNIRVSIKSDDSKILEHITIREALHIRSRSGMLKADPLPIISQNYLLTIPSQENSQIFLDINSQKLDNGAYHWTLELIDTENSTIKIPYTLLVDKKISPEIQPQIIVWDCSLRMSSGLLADNIAKELAIRGVNIFHIINKVNVEFNANGTIKGEVDFSDLNDAIKRVNTYSKIMLFRTIQHPFAQNHKRNKITNIQCHDGLIIYNSPQWHRALNEWLNLFSQNMEKLNIPYERWALYPYDEYLGEHFIKLAKAIRKYNPQIQIFANPAGKISPTDLAKLCQNDLIDIVTPFEQRYYRYDDARKFMQKNIHPYVKNRLTYFCGWPQKDFNVADFYLALPWRMSKNANSGGGFWTATGLNGIDWGGDSWDDFDSNKPNPEVLYYTAQDVVPSRRYLAFSAGIEDWRLLSYIKNNNNRLKAELLVDQFLKSTDNLAQIEQIRKDLQRLVKEQK